MLPIWIVPILCVCLQRNVFCIMIAVGHTASGGRIRAMIGDERLLALAVVIGDGGVVVADGTMVRISESRRRRSLIWTRRSVIVVWRRRDILMVIVVGGHAGAEARLVRMGDGVQNAVRRKSSNAGKDEKSEDRQAYEVAGTVEWWRRMKGEKGVRQSR